MENAIERGIQSNQKVQLKKEQQLTNLLPPSITTTTTPPPSSETHLWKPWGRDMIPKLQSQDWTWFYPLFSFD